MKIDNRLSIFKRCLMLLLFFASTVHAHLSDYFKFEPYMGFGASYLNIRGAAEQSRGRNGTNRMETIKALSDFQKRHFYTLEGFMGMKFSKYFGLEFGHQQSNTLRKTVSGDPVRFVSNFEDTTSVTSSVSLRMLYLDFHGYYHFNEKWVLDASIGGAYIDPRVQYSIIDQAALITIFSQQQNYDRFVPRGSLSVIYNCTDLLALRVGAYYINTSRMKADFCDERIPPNCYLDSRLFKDSMGLSIALIAKFC